MEKEIDYLEKYLSLEKVTRNDSFEYIIKVDPGLDLESETLPMIIQPFLENSIIHGFKKMDRKAKLNLSFKEEAGNLKVEVLDNGMGRMMDATKTTQKESLGLSVVKERLGLNYGYQFLDLKDEQGIPSGTKVIIKMPLK